MKKYNKPSFEFVELRVEERLARCFNHEHTHPGGPQEDVSNHGHAAHLSGCYPGCRYHCPHE